MVYQQAKTQNVQLIPVPLLQNKVEDTFCYLNSTRISTERQGEGEEMDRYIYIYIIIINPVQK